MSLVCSFCVAVRAHQLTFADFGKNSSLAVAVVYKFGYFQRLIGSIQMIPVHHVVGVGDATVCARPILQDLVPTPKLSSMSFSQILTRLFVLSVQCSVKVLTTGLADTLPLVTSSMKVCFKLRMRTSRTFVHSRAGGSRTRPPPVPKTGVAPRDYSSLVVPISPPIKRSHARGCVPGTIVHPEGIEPSQRRVKAGYPP
jgi:hypothetical protein